MALLGGNRKTVGVLTYIGEGSDLEGNLRTNGSARVDGRVRGSVIVDGDLEVGPNGHIEGEQVRANNILIHGRISAQVMAGGKLVLTKNGQLEGDVRAISLDIEAGAIFVGRSQTGEPKALPKSS